MNSRRLLLSFSLLPSALLASAVFADKVAPPALDGPLSTAEAMQSFDLEPGLKVELVAAEPLTVSPVAIAFDDRGRMYVAENRGYPTGPSEGEPPLGRIALLEDTDGDGAMDRRREFATGLSYPNGLLPHQGGMIVTCAPDILFLRDTDDDGVADEKRVLFTGFSTAGSTQLRVSHPTRSIDNWIYVTSGLTGGSVISPDAPDRAPVELKRTDFRFRPDGSIGEAADGGAQFGLTFDDFGRRFICYNRVQVQHVVLGSKHLGRNPHLAFSETVHNCPAEMVGEPLKGHGAAARLFPISNNVTTADSHAGTFTAACAVTVFRGEGLPERYSGGAFSCDPTGNLVHFDKLEPLGATFAARRIGEGTEFLRSSDSWFRPVFLANAPDGALYVCDMYRKTIEHPDYLPVEIRKRTDFEGGKNMGRIWRVSRDDVPADDWKRRREVDFDASPAELVQALKDQRGWRRDAAQRLLLEKPGDEATRAVTTMLEDPKARSETVVHVLHILSQYGSLTDDQLRSALTHPAPQVREHALQLVEARLPHHPQWSMHVLPLANDADARVRFQLALLLGNLPAADEAEANAISAALARIAAEDNADRWARAAIFSSLTGRERLFLASLLELPSPEAPIAQEFFSDLGRLFGASLKAEDWPGAVQSVLESKATSFDQRAAFVFGLGEAMRGKIAVPEKGSLLLAGLAVDQNTPVAGLLGQLFTDAKRIVLSPDAPVPSRESAAKLLGYSTFDESGETLLSLVQPEQPGAVQSAAIRSLGMLRDEQIAAALLEPARFDTYTPSLREEVLAVLSSDTVHLSGLLAAIEGGSIPASAVDALRRQQFTQHRDPAIRTRAEKLFAAVSGDRGKLYEKLKPVAELPGNADKGHAVFKRACATCHRLDREGFAVGPDLFGIRNQPKPAILLHIIAPDHEITPGFAAYSVVTTDGRAFTGLIAAESPTTLTLKLPQGKEESFLRSDIEELAASKLSLMPQGLEQNITEQEFADLLSYLKGERSIAAVQETSP